VAESCTGDSVACPIDGLADDGTACADADLCDGAETCAAGACTEGAALDCDDVDACTADACDATGGCSHTPIAGCGDSGVVSEALEESAAWPDDDPDAAVEADAGADAAEDIDAGPETVPSSAGCACRVPSGGARPGAGAAVGLGLLGLALLARRRR